MEAIPASVAPDTVAVGIQLSVISAAASVHPHRGGRSPKLHPRVRRGPGCLGWLQQLRCRSPPVLSAGPVLVGLRDRVGFRSFLQAVAGVIDYVLLERPPN